MRAWVDSQHDWLRAERLPAYAPDLNPVEGLWANLKDLELANLPTTMAGLLNIVPRYQRHAMGILFDIREHKMAETCGPVRCSR